MVEYEVREEAGGEQGERRGVGCGTLTRPFQQLDMKLKLTLTLRMKLKPTFGNVFLHVCCFICFVDFVFCCFAVLCFAD